MNRVLQIFFRLPRKKFIRQYEIMRKAQILNSITRKRETLGKLCMEKEKCQN